MTAAGRLLAIDDALAAIAGEDRARAGAAAIAALALDLLGLDEDDLAAATRRGLLLAAATGDPRGSIGPGSRAALETAFDLAADGIPAALSAALRSLAETAAGTGLTHAAALARSLASDDAAALEALAVVVLAIAADG